MKIGAIIQARMGSSRLPGKVMLNLYGKYVIDHVIERVKQCKYIDEIIIATTTCENDDKIIEQAQKNEVKYFRGSEDDVLSRYYYAAVENKLDVIVRITSDCPLIDPSITAEIIKFYIENKYEIVSNEGPNVDEKTYPRGLDTEVFSFRSLEEAYMNAKENYQREHVTPYIYENYINLYYYKNNKDYSKYRWTLDTDQDWQLIQEIYRNLYKGMHDFYFEDIVALFSKNPELIKINEGEKQKELK